MEKRLLVVIDCQNDFIDGSLGTPEAMAIVDKVAEKIKTFDGEIAATYDTHFEDSYLNSNEGKHLPVKHCILHTEGWQLNPTIEKAFRDRLAEKNEKFSYNDDKRVFLKESFGSFALAQAIVQGGFDYVELIGLCTDICVVTNALVIKTAAPEIQIACDFSCCAGVTPELHNAAKMVMHSCQIDEVTE